MTLDLFSYKSELDSLKKSGWFNGNREDSIEKSKSLPKIIYVTARQLLSEVLQEVLKIHDTLAVDIETFKAAGYEEDPSAGLDPYRSEIRLVQFYGGGNVIYVFDVKKLGGIKSLGSEIWKKPMVAHNAIFEIKHLMNKGVHPKSIGCTMLLANSLFGGKLRSLKVLVSEILGEELSKQEQTSDWSQDDLYQDQIEYAAKDAFVTYKIFRALYPKLKEKDLGKTYSVMRDAQHAIARMELAGVLIDTENHDKLILSWEQERTLYEAKLKKILGDDFKLTSTKELGEWIEKNADVSKWPRTKTGKLQVDASALSQNRDLVISEPLLKYKEFSKLLNTYGRSFAKHINPETGRIHASFRLGGTATGRLSCTRPNIQNPPRDPAFRNLFVADRGNVLVVADYSQVELRVAAIVSQDREMLKAYENGEDLHRKTAAVVLGISQSEVSKDQRQMAKAVNFGLLYGQGAKGLSAYAKQNYGVDMDLKEAKRARKAFFDTYSGLATWQRNTGRRAEALQKVTTPLGRERDFGKEERGYRFTEALNTPIQGGAAEAMLCSLIQLEKLLDGKRAKIVNVIHDEIVVECPEDMGEDVKALVEKAMINGFLEVFPDGKPFTKDLVDAKINTNWADAK